jgi:YD repeat-containing protein
MRRRILLPTSLICVLALAASLFAQGGTIRYIYDELGRLVGVIDASGNAAAYHYDAVGNLLSITRTISTEVAIIEFTPDAGPIGQTVTIDGTGFSATPGQNTVTFNGTAASVSSATTTRLVVTVPASATTGIISITSPNGSANSSTSFVVTTSMAPTISGFSPSVGAAGTSVTISGTNFDTVAAQNRTVVNLTRASVTTASSTSLALTVPAGAASGRFAVTTPNGNVVSTDDFFIPPAPYGASDVVSTARLVFSQLLNFNIGTASKVGLVVFDGTAGQRVALKIVPGPISGVSLLRPSQSVLQTHSTGIGTTLMEPPLLPVTGTYQFLVDPVGSSTGSTALTLYDVPADYTTTIGNGAPGVTVSTTVPGQNGQLTFTGAVNDRASVVVSAGPLGSVVLQKPDGSTLASVPIGIVAGFIDTTVLPVAGTYTLFVNYSNANTGSVTVTRHAVPADVSGTIPTDGTATAVVITTPGQNGELTFSGTSTHRMSLKVSSGPAGSVSLRKPDGSQVAAVTSGPATFMEPQTLDTTGTHAVRVNPSGANSGTLTLNLYDVPADTTGTVTIGGSAVAVPLAVPGQVGTRTFSGTASQVVTVRVTGNTFGITTVRLLKPDGTQLTSATSLSGSFNLPQQTLPTTGTYTIVVDPSAANVGTLNVAVTNP